MYGAYGAEVEDFDLDGDYDIAAISFHPDFNQEKIENFVYLEQGSELVFSAKTHPATSNGRWLTIDSGDLDGDGDKDLVLGAALLPVGMSAEQQEALGKVFAESSPVLFLENQTRPRKRNSFPYALSSFSVFNFNWPQAAAMSWPFSRRIVAEAP